MWRTTVPLLLSLVLGVLMAPHAAEAQGRGYIPLVGVLEPNPSTTRCFKVFQQGLRDLGYVEGQHITFAYRYAAHQFDQLPALAAELVRLAPDVIWTHANPPAQAAKRATTTIPIVVGVGNELVEQGLAESMARPGSNLTGLDLRRIELMGKRLELLKEAVPTITHVAVLIYARGIASQPYPSAFEAEAQALGARLQRVDAGTPEAIDAALATIATSGAEALMIQDNPMFTAHRQRILDFAHTHRLPTACGVRAYAEAGCLIAYAPDILAMYRRAAIFVDKILKGTTPAEKPVELPHKLNLFLNVKTAETLGITLPPSLLRLADEVIK